MKKEKQMRVDILSEPWISVYRVDYKKGGFVVYLHYNHESGRVSLSRHPEDRAQDYHFENSDPETLKKFVLVAQKALSTVELLKTFTLSFKKNYHDHRTKNEAGKRSVPQGLRRG